MEATQYIKPHIYRFNGIMETFAYNIVAKDVNEYLNGVHAKDVSYLNIPKVEEAIYYSTLNPKELTVEQLKAIADDIIDDIRRCEYEL